ncbi:MAG: quinolinate synthase NadA [Anaerolineae bacterium]|nr:quinolinate synthase NadA [Anaerolineae bacterium]
MSEPRQPAAPDLDIVAAARPLIDLALAEDIGPGDATSQAVLPPDLTLHGRVVAKAHGVVAGLPIAEAVFQRVDPALRFTPYVWDGDEVDPGTLIAEVTGPARSMLAAERTALNVLQHLSGIATLTRAFVDAVEGTGAAVLDTRKTHPGYRILEKYAVRMGGGQNHRMSLYDMMMIKDNHVDAAGSIAAAVERARAAHPTLPIEVEVRTLDELRQALPLTLDRILLDNMDLDQMRAAVALAAGRTPLEASGGVTLERVAAIAATGVDFVSVGALTHSAPALDISMKIAESTSPFTGRTSHFAISNLKSTLGDQLVILGHHYQHDEVLQFADFRGDSLKLARDAAACQDARFIVFCGVHFMAETAAILAQPHQTVLLPDVEAGCGLAAMANLPAVERAWEDLSTALDVEREVMPITYVNSAATLKAFCGRHGGLVCTSSNAEAALRWALERRPRVLFFPDQHLGRNTARRLGVPTDDMLLWDPRYPSGGHDETTLRRARIFLWRGHCYVHQRFRPEHVAAWRARVPGIQVIVHPECPAEVVDLADAAGSTDFIIRQVEAAPPGTRWAIGTEFNLVNRLQQAHPEQFIASLTPEPSTCRTMGRITLARLARVLDGLARGEIINPITVPDDVARWAKVALERMLEVQ